MQKLRSIHWTFTLACLAVVLATASFVHQYLELDYLSSSVVGLFGWIGLVFAVLIESDETQGKA
jgi:drug/metabolite transporter (DMT)-like permease